MERNPSQSQMDSECEEKLRLKVKRPRLDPDTPTTFDRDFVYKNAKLSLSIAIRSSSDEFLNLSPSLSRWCCIWKTQLLDVSSVLEKLIMAKENKKNATPKVSRLAFVYTQLLGHQGTSLGSACLVISRFGLPPGGVFVSSLVSCHDIRVKL